MRLSIIHTLRARATAPALRPLTSQIVFQRSYANKENMSSTQGQASPGTASNVAPTNPESASADHKDMKISRGQDGVQDSPDTKSVQTPVSNPTGSQTGEQEADSSAQSAFKQDPNASDAEKRKNVEEMGNRKLDPADK